MSAALGASIPFHRNMQAGMIPAALADELKGFAIEGKDGLIVLNDRPVNAETPAHLLDDPVTPTERHFIRNNGIRRTPSMPPVGGSPSTARSRRLSSLRSTT